MAQHVAVQPPALSECSSSSAICSFVIFRWPNAGVPLYISFVMLLYICTGDRSGLCEDGKVCARSKGSSQACVGGVRW